MNDSETLSLWKVHMWYEQSLLLCLKLCWKVKLIS